MIAVPSPPPPPLVVSASLIGLQGVGVVVLALLELLNLNADRIGLGASTALFFALYGVLLVAGAYSLYRLRAWARGPALLSQLIWLGIAWNVRDEPLLAIGVALVAVIALAGVVHPDSIAALDRTAEAGPDA